MQKRKKGNGNRDMVPREEIAAHYGISTKTVYRRQQNGLLPKTITGTTLTSRPVFEEFRRREDELALAATRASAAMPIMLEKKKLAKKKKAAARPGNRRIKPTRR